MSDRSTAEDAGAEDWLAGPELGPEIQLAVARLAERELAQRAISGAMVYFAVTLLLALSTSYYDEHPALLLGTGILMLVVGGVRLFSARRILNTSPPLGSRAAFTLRSATYVTAGVWGLFCAITMRLYPNQWTAMFVLLSTAALCSGLAASLAPDVGLAARSLVLVVVPTVVVAGSDGDRGHLAFAAATAIYLIFLLTQTRDNGRAFWKVCVAAESERLRNSAERQRIEAERATLSVAIEQSAEEILITDADGKIRYCNPAFERLSGYPREEVIGRNANILKSDKHDPEFFQELWSTLREGRVWSGRFVNRRKDGSVYEVEGTISPMNDASGRLTGYVSARHDVTERLRLEAELRQAQKLESVGRLAGGIAHDFNNVLTVILGYSRVLQEAHSSPDDPMREHVLEISAAGERAAGLTRQLLSFSRKQIILPRPVALEKLVAEMRPMLQRLVGEDIRVESPPPKRCYVVRTDPDQMNQLLLNLAANARDAMPHGGALTISLQDASPSDIPAGAPQALSNGPSVRLTVSDTGLGMDERTRLRLFEPFFTTKEHGHGTGLGLATVYGIVQQSEGFIEADSEPGKGAAFHIYLPLIEDPTETPEPEQRQERGAGGSETILVAEDQDDLRGLVATVLRSSGYQVLDAADGGSAIQIARETNGRIDLLLTDVIMPDLNGKQVADVILQARPDIRVLFMSGYADEVIARKGVLDSGIAYLPKPFSIEALTAKVREVLDAPR